MVFVYACVCGLLFITAHRHQFYGVQSGRGSRRQAPHHNQNHLQESGLLQTEAEAEPVPEPEPGPRPDLL